jgi:HK97 gp10 family phage protein
MPVIKEGTRAVQRDAKTFAPVYPHKAKPPYSKQALAEAGHLRNSISTKMFPSQQTGIVFTNVEYAIYQEFGTRYQSGTAFMIPAMMANRNSIKAKMKSHIKSELQKATR